MLLSTERRTDLIALAVILAAVLFTFRGLAGGDIVVSNDVGTNDLLYFNYPVGKLYGESLRRGELLQWTPYIYGGFPVFAEGQGSFLYPPQALLWWLLPPVGAMNLYIILHALLMGAGVYFLAKHITGASGWYALPAGLAGALCGSVVVGHLRHLNPLAVIALTPWLFLAAEYFATKGRWHYGLYFGLLLAMMALAGHPNFTFIAGSLATLYLPLRRYAGPRADTAARSVTPLQLALFLGAAAAVAVLVALPQLTATVQLMQFSRRVAEPANNFDPTHGSLPWQGILGFILPYYHGTPADGSLDLKATNPLFFTEGFVYCGLLLFALAVAGAIWGWSCSGAARAFTIIAVVSFLLALGDNFVLHRVLLLFPLAGSFRLPMRWLLGTEISVLALSVFGVRWIAELAAQYLKRGAKQPGAAGGAALAGGIIALLCFADLYAVTGRHVATDAPATHLSPSGFATRLLQPQNRGRVLALGKFQMHVMAYEQHKGWQGDRSLFELHTRLLPPNLSAAHHITAMNGYAILAPNYIYKLWGDAMSGEYYAAACQYNEAADVVAVDPHFITVARAFGVRYVTSPWKMPDPFVPVWDTADVRTAVHVYAYELPGVFPRAWVVPHTLVVPPQDADAAVRAVTGTSFDPAQTAVVSGDMPVMPPDAAAGTADLLSVSNTYVKIRANAPGLLVLSDTWYPRWKATVDGVEAPVLRVNSMMRGVVVPRAGSVVQMRYSDGGVYWMILGSLVVAVGAAFTAWRAGNHASAGTHTIRQTKTPAADSRRRSCINS